MRRCTAQRTAQERQPPEPIAGGRPRECGEVSGDRDRALVQRDDTELQARVRWWRDGSADGDDDLQRRWRQTRASGGAVQALESGDEAQDFQWRRESKADGGNRLMVEVRLEFGADEVKNDANVCAVVHTDSQHCLGSSGSGVC